MIWTRSGPARAQPRHTNSGTVDPRPPSGEPSARTRVTSSVCGAVGRIADRMHPAGVDGGHPQADAALDRHQRTTMNASGRVKVSLARRGLFEISMRLMIGAVIGCVGAVVWSSLAGGPFAQKLGNILVVSGMLMTMAPSGAFTRMATADMYAWLGRGPDKPYEEDGGPGLTRLGVMLFTSIPLIVIGVLLS